MPIPLNESGELDLRFKGTQVSLKVAMPPQSEAPMLITMTLDQYETLGALCYSSQGDSEVCRRIYRNCQVNGDKVQTLVPSADYKLIVDSIACGKTEGLESLFKQVIEADRPVRYIG